MPNAYTKLDLLRVLKPSQYIGGEINSTIKTQTDGKKLTRFCFIYPDLYEIGMSYLGLHIIYQGLNERDDIFCERAFMPAKDMLEQMSEKNVHLFTLETKTPLHEMDIIGFTLQYELSYTNILKMLILGGIEPLSKNRENAPLVIAGGPCAYNPEPLADFIDLFVIGEWEEISERFMDLAVCYNLKNKSERNEFLRKASRIPGIYVPSEYIPVYDGDHLLGYEMAHGGELRRVRKTIVKDFESAFQLTNPIVPYAPVVHDRAVMEIFRGCTKGCRFCQAGMLYRPVRERSKQTIVDSISRIIDNTGYDEVSLSSLSTLDYSEIEDLTELLLKRFEGSGVSVSVPSLRLDSKSYMVLEKLQTLRKTGITFAPEAGTQRLRDVINKGISAEDIKSTFIRVFQMGWFRMKLYFMIGLPTETKEDLDGINEISNMAVYLHKMNKPEYMNKQPEVRVSASCFVPKPFTPFQWHGQSSIEELEVKANYLKSIIRNKKVRFSYHDPRTSWLEGVFARGDRRVGAVILEAVKSGCMLDGWREHFRFDLWIEAFENCGIDPKYYNERNRDYNEFLPWDIIDPGISKEYLIKESQKAQKNVLTPDCDRTCNNCGIMDEIMPEGCPCLVQVVRL